MQPERAIIKLVLLGEEGVGKSSLVSRFAHNQFSENTQSTIGAAYLAQKCQIGGKEIKFEIWDTAGQERYHSLAPMYYRTAKSAIVVYDIASKNSFNKAKLWIKELQQQASPDILIGFVGNKLDLANMREVDTKEAELYATDLGLLFFEASAKDGTNVKEVFLEIASKLPEEIFTAKKKVREVELLKDDPPPQSTCYYC